MELGLDLKLRSWSWNWSWNLRSWNWSWSWYSEDLLELELELESKPPELELELIFWRFAGVGIGVGVETSGVGVDILEIGRSWSWSWNLWSWSWSWSWYYGVDPNPGCDIMAWCHGNIDAANTWLAYKLAGFFTLEATLRVLIMTCCQKCHPFYCAISTIHCITSVTSQAYATGLFRYLYCPVVNGVGLWNGWPGFDSRTVCYSQGNLSQQSLWHHAVPEHTVDIKRSKSRTCQSNSLTLVRKSGRDKHSPYWKGTILRTIPEWNSSVTVRLQPTHLPPSRVGWPLHQSAPSLVRGLPLPGRPVSVCHWSTCGLLTKTRQEVANKLAFNIRGQPTVQRPYGYHAATAIFACQWLAMAFCRGPSTDG